MNLNERMHQVEEMLAETLAKIDNQGQDIATLKHEVGKLRTGQLQLMQTYIRQSDNIEFLLAKTVQIEERLNQLDNRIAILEQRMDKLEQRIDKLEQRMDKLEQRMDKLEERMDKLDQRMDRLDQRMDGMEQKIHVLEGKIDLVLVLLQEKLK